MYNYRALKKFLSYYKPYRGLLCLDLVCAVIVSGITLVLPLCASAITKDILGSGAPDALAQITAMGGLMLALLALMLVCNTFVDYQGHMMGTLMERDVRQELFAHFQTLPFSFHDETRTGQMMSRITNDLNAMSELFHHGPEELVIALLKFGGAFVILSSINTPLTLLLFLFMPLMAAYAFYFNRRMNTGLTHYYAGMGSVNEQVEDSLAGIRVVQSFANEAIERAKFAAANQRFVEARRAVFRSEAYFYQGMVAFTQLLTIAIIIFGGTAILDGTLQLADLLTYLLFVAILIDPIQKFVNLARLYQEGAAGFSRFLEILAIVPNIQDAPDALDLKHVEGHLQFRAVSFKYKADHDDVVKQVSLDIRPGETVALVGSSGVGKTTLCALIPRFYEVTSGEILLDGVNIKRLRLQALRRQIGGVQQYVYLFAGTVADNIRYGKLDATDEEIIAAAKKANAHDFIIALPDGYHTQIGQRGVKLSGGQKQRLSIARVFLKDPPILILDEATSALDNASEHAVQASLERLAHNRSTLIIAHRLSTIINAHRIIVLTPDGIAEQGSHTELLARGGAYARLYAMQLTL